VQIARLLIFFHASGILILGGAAGVIGWILIIISLIGMFIVGALSVSDKHQKRHFQKLREESNRKRDDYFILSDKRDPPAPRVIRVRRPRFLP
jgi:hypothetical protein